MRLCETVVLAAVSLFAGTACPFSVDVDDGRFQCDDTHVCPADRECVMGFCEPRAEQNDGDPGDGDPDGAPGSGICDTTGPANPEPSNPCSSITNARDDFSSGDAWEPTEEAAGCSITFDTDEIHLRGDGDRCLTLSDATHYMDDRASIEVRRLGSPAAFGISFSPNVPSLVAVLEGNEVNAREINPDGTIANDDLDYGHIVYDPKDFPGEYRYLAFRAIPGPALCFETSEDGQSWSQHGVYQLSEEQQGECVKLEFDVLAVDGNGESTEFDNLNLIDDTKARRPR